jgi:hypothetical protein
MPAQARQPHHQGMSIGTSATAGPAAGGGTLGQDATTVYALGSSPGESARLQRQAEELAAGSAALLDRVGLRPGQANGFPCVG